MVNSTPLTLVLHTRDGGEPWIIEQKLFDILNTYLQPNTTLSPIDAAKEIDKLFPLNRPREVGKENEAPESFLLEMWDVFIGVAEQIPWKSPEQDRLVEVIRALRDLPEPTTIHMDGWGDMEVWSGLPLLRLEMTERSHSIDLEDSSDAQEAIRKRQENFIAFAAHLTQKGIADRSQYFAIPYIREALEQEPDRRAKAYLKQGSRLDAYVPCAAIWILIAGNVIFTHCRARVGSTQEDSDVRGRNWKGTKGFSIERWNFWKQRFGEIRVHEQATEKIKGLAAEAEEAMRRIQTGNLVI